MGRDDDVKENKMRSRQEDLNIINNFEVEANKRKKMIEDAMRDLESQRFKMKEYSQLNQYMKR